MLCGRTCRGGWGVFLAALLTGAMWGVCPSRGLGGEQYAVIDVPALLLEDTPEAKKTKRELEMRVQGIITSAPGSPTIDDDKAKRDVDNYYKRFYFPLLTHHKELSNWVDRRERFLKLLQQSNVTANAKAHDYVVNAAYEVAATIAKGNYYPGARYNAMLLIGKLNAEEGVFVGESRKLPVPLIVALRLMLDEFEDPKQIDAVRMAALVGIQRHVDIDREAKSEEQRRLVGKDPESPNSAETRIINVMSAVVNEKEPPKGRNREGQLWIRRSAVDILARLGSVGRGGRVVKLLDGLLADDTEAVALRCSAAEALGRLNYPKNAAYDAKDLAKKVGTVAIVATLEQVRRSDEQQQREAKEREAEFGPAAGDYGPSMMPSQYGGGPSGSAAPDPFAYRLDYTRRVIKSRLVMARIGLVGPFDATKTNAPPRPPAPVSKDSPPPPEPKLQGIISLAKQPPDKEYVGKVIDGVDKIISVTDSTSSKDMASLLAAVRTNVTNMENGCGIVVKQQGAAELTAAEREKILANPDLPEPGPPALPGKPPSQLPPGKEAKPTTPPSKEATPAPPPGKEPIPAPPPGKEPTPTPPPKGPPPAPPPKTAAPKPPPATGAKTP